MSSAPLSPEDIITLPACCDFPAAEELQPLLVLAADRGAIAIDASAVTSLGQSVLQLLLAARAEPVSFAVRSASGAFAARVAGCGLTAELALAEWGAAQ